MDCKSARLLLEFDRPAAGELDAAEAVVLQQHLQSCPDCHEAAQAERRLDEAVGQAMRAVPIPDGLRMRLLGRLQVDRDRWYRRFGLRVAAAAAVFLLLAGGVTWLGMNRPGKIDLPRAQANADERMAATRTRVDEWLKHVGGQNLEAPPNFEYALLESYALTNFEGFQDVPTLYFRSSGGRAFAKVFVLSGQRFDLSYIQGQADPSLKSGPVKVDVRTHPTNLEILYLVFYNSDNLTPFLAKEQGPLS
jgi:hypothetical protein